MQAEAEGWREGEMERERKEVGEFKGYGELEELGTSGEFGERNWGRGLKLEKEKETPAFQPMIPWLVVLRKETGSECYLFLNHCFIAYLLSKDFNMSRRTKEQEHSRAA